MRHHEPVGGLAISLFAGWALRFLPRWATPALIAASATAPAFF